MKDIYILGIESSCDDTGAAIIASPRQILSNIVISQNSEHMPFCGVVPEIAARSHMQNLEHAIHMALSEAKLDLTDIDAIAATSGPGLIGGVIVGSMLGRALSSVLKKPFIAVNHLEGHALSACLSHGISFPYLLLLVSGGHCQFVAIQSLGRYKILGQTIDDAVGEAFDKVAKMLGLPFPGGPEIEKLAKLGDPYKYILPKPIINQDNCNMSFSGLKTAIRTLISQLNINDKQTINDIAASFQYTIGCILSIKLAKAIAMYEQLSNTPIDLFLSSTSAGDLDTGSVPESSRTFEYALVRSEESPANPSSPASFDRGLTSKPTIVVAGGVAANQYIINILQEKASTLGYTLIAPPIKLCTDNAAMIAFAGLERLKAGLTNSNSFCPRARWSLEEL